MVKVEDIQIRLQTTVQGISFVTTWWGPKDNMRFAAIKHMETAKTDEEIAQAEKLAVRRFIEKIREIQNGFAASTDDEGYPRSRSSANVPQPYRGTDTGTGSDNGDAPTE